MTLFVLPVVSAIPTAFHWRLGEKPRRERLDGAAVLTARLSA